MMTSSDEAGETFTKMLYDDLCEATHNGITLRAVMASFGAILEELFEALPKAEREAAWEFLSKGIQRRLERMS